MTASQSRRGREPRLLYLSFSATSPGQAGWSHVDEVVGRLRKRGWTVELQQPSYVGKKAPGGFGRLVAALRVQARLSPRLRRFDALYVRVNVLAFPLALLARITGIPVVQECNGLYEDLFIAWPQLRRFRRLLVWMVRAQYRWANELVTVTPELGRWLEQEAGHGRVTVVPNGANTDLFTPDAVTTRALPTPYAVFFGSLAPWQGIPTILAATEHDDWPPDTRLVVAGDGALRAAVERAASGGRVVYLGSCPQHELPGIVAGAVASFSVQDDDTHASFGLSPLKLYESMAAGVPVVVSALPGLEDVVARFECGLVVPPGDAGAIARAVATLTDSPELRRGMGARGREAAVTLYSWETAAQAEAGVIRRAIVGRHKR